MLKIPSHLAGPTHLNINIRLSRLVDGGGRGQLQQSLGDCILIELRLISKARFFRQKLEMQDNSRRWQFNGPSKKVQAIV